MCFYHQYRFTCRHWKWGNFRMYCSQEYPVGETCGIKLVMQSMDIDQKCRLCDKIDTKQRRRNAEKDRINRWRKEGGKFTASIERSLDIVAQIERELLELYQERRKRTLGLRPRINQQENHAIQTGTVAHIEQPSSSINKRLSEQAPTALDERKPIHKEESTKEERLKVYRYRKSLQRDGFIEGRCHCDHKCLCISNLKNSMVRTLGIA